MQEPTPRIGRAAIAGGLAALLAIGGLGFALGRDSAPRPAPLATPAPVPAPSPPPEPKAEPRVLGRAEIVALAADAADSFSRGEALPGADGVLSGQRFSISLPFGCDGPSPEGSGATQKWSYDRETEILRVSATPVRWRGEDWGFSAGQAAAVLEGFWVSRPWSHGDTCPRPGGHSTPSDDQPVTLPGQTLALAQFLGDDPQTSPRGFEVTRKIAPSDLRAAEGFRLRLSGRLGRLPDGGVVRCTQPAGIDQRPICLIAVAPDEVTLEAIATGRQLATWPIETRAAASEAMR